MFVNISEDDDTHRSANAQVYVDSDDAIAEALVDCLRAIAAHRGPGLQLALAKRVTFR